MSLLSVYRLCRISDGRERSRNEVELGARVRLALRRLTDTIAYSRGAGAIPLAALTRDAVLKAIGEFDALGRDELGQAVARARTAESAAATGVARSLP